MLAVRWAQVLRLTGQRSGLQDILTDLGPALCYPRLTGSVIVGDRVLLNVLATERHLGTGGFHLVMAVDGRQDDVPAGGGRHVKLRYTPWQLPVQAGEEVVAPPPDLMRLPVVAGSLHSQLGPVAAAFKEAAPECRLAYVMTDGGALPVWLSQQLDELRGGGLIEQVITAGHAFGGDVEAVGVPSALLLARGLGCDAAIVCMGPGVAGTGTPWGHSGLEQAWALQAAAVLGGLPIACPRVGTADPRPRHRGLSHHTRTTLGRLCAAPALVAWPAGVDPAPLRPLAARHALVQVECSATLAAVRQGLAAHRTMGRGWAEEEPLFAAAVAAGMLAALLVSRPKPAG